MSARSSSSSFHVSSAHTTSRSNASGNNGYTVVPQTPPPAEIPEDDVESVSLSDLEKRKPTKEQIAQQQQLSFTIWKRVNPGYSANMYRSSNHDSFTVDNSISSENFDRDFLNKQHFRKADKNTEYVEASARYKLLMQKNAPASGK